MDKLTPGRSPSGRILTLSQNLRGRDFVTGDIHGAYRMLGKGLSAVNFDPLVDRIIVPGDLIDRGKDSHEVTTFLRWPFGYATRGNHDEDFTTLDPEQIRVLAGINYQGLEWAKDLSDEAILEIQEEIKRLPIVIQVPTPRGVVGFVHGDVPKGMHWNLFLQRIEEGDAAALECALTGRDRVSSSDTSGIEGVGRLFTGHSIQWDGPKKLSNVYLVDTGAVFAEKSLADVNARQRGFMSIANIASKTESLAVRGTHLDGRVIAIDSPVDTPFTSYIDARQRGG